MAGLYHSKSISLDTRRAILHPQNSYVCITTPFRLFEFIRMPFGLRSAVQTLQQCFTFCYMYINNVLIASTTREEHTQHLRLVFQCFKEYGVIFNPSKCNLGITELTFLEHTLTI